jgi:hypothetical protein
MSLKGKRGQGLVTGIIAGIGGLVITSIVIFLIVSTLNGAGLLTSGTAEQNSTDQMISNFTTGVNNVSNKLPTVLLVAAVVILFGAIVLLVSRKCWIIIPKCL